MKHHIPIASRRSTGARTTGALLGAAMLVVTACSSSSSSPTTAASSAPATSAAPATTAAPRPIGFTVAFVEPAAGLLGDLSVAQRRGVEDAVADLNAAGGVLGGNVAITTVTERANGDAAAAVTDAKGAGANAIVGPVGSSSALAMLPALDSANLVGCSASATSPALAGVDPNHRFFRTALSDDHLVAVVADAVAKRLTAGATVTVVARNDQYGAGVGGGLANSLTAQGMKASLVSYDASNVLFATTAAAVAATAPQQVVMVSYGESALLLAELVKAGIATTSIIGLDGSFTPRLALQAFPDAPTKADGTTIIGATGNRDYLASLLSRQPDGEVIYAAQAYDCVVSLALAAQAAGTIEAAKIAEQMTKVTGGGTTCTTVADCLTKLGAGEDIDYDGQSGKIAFDDNGEPSTARITTTVIAGGELKESSAIDIDLAAQKNDAAYQAAIASATFVTTLQAQLKLLGYYAGPIDGVYNEATKAALSAFQAASNLPATGEYDQATDEALRGKIGGASTAVSQATANLQVVLTQLGFYKGPIDGKYSPATIDAVKALQAELGVGQTGIIDGSTLAAAYEQGLANAPTPEPPATTTPPPTSVAPPPTTAPPAQPDLIDTLAHSPEYSTLAGLVLLAGLRDTLSGPGPFTVFAPTNEAFAKLPPAALGQLVADPAALKALLLNHVAAGAHPAASLTEGNLASLGTLPLRITIDGAGVHASGATVVAADISASNGIIHGIDTVITGVQPL